MALSIHDKFKIHRIHNLSGEDYYALAQMYLPIIGIDSYGLYSLLFTLNDNEMYSFKKIIDILNLSTSTFLDKAFSKLEAVSLVESFYNQQKGFIYNLKTPLSPTSFLENPLLTSFLKSQIGDVEVTKLVDNITKLNIKTYKEITKSFDQVYDVTSDDIENIFSKIYKVKNKSQLKVTNPNFDYIFFKMNFDSSFIDPKILDDEEFKQQILTISFNYKLNEEDMKEVILKTITLDNDLKYNDLSKNARNLYQQKNRNKKTRFVTKEPDAFISSETDDDTYRFIEKVENIAPADLLEELSGIKPSVSELKLIEDLINNTNFPLSVVNTMILLVNNEKNGELPGYNYFEKIANTWARAKIKTPYDVINYINKERTKTAATKTNYRNGKKVAKVPDWYDKYEKQLENLPKIEKMSQSEIDKVLEEAKKEFG